MTGEREEPQVGAMDGEPPAVDAGEAGALEPERTEPGAEPERGQEVGSEAAAFERGDVETGDLDSAAEPPAAAVDPIEALDAPAWTGEGTAADTGSTEAGPSDEPADEAASAAMLTEEEARPETAEASDEAGAPEPAASASRESSARLSTRPQTAGQLVAAGLAAAGVRLAFTVPGESFLGALEAFAAHGIRVVGTRHESGAAFMAEAVGQLTGRPAVCLATRAVGAANLAIGLHTARADSSPVVAVVGQVQRPFVGREAFQEADLVGSIGRLCKWAAEAETPEAVPGLVATAVQQATTGRPGPVLLSLPEDVLDLPVESGHGTTPAIRGRAPEPDGDAVHRVLHLLAAARRPLILAGAGVLRARCSDALVRFAELLEVPVVAAWRRPDVFPNDHRLYLGSSGYAAAATVLPRLLEADALLVLGCRLDEVASHEYRVPGEGTRWAQVDLEPRGGRHGLRAPDIAVGADVSAFLRAATRRLSAGVLDARAWDERRAANDADRAAFEAASVVDAEPWSGPGVHPGRVIATLGRVLPAEALLATDAGNFSGWAARGYRFRRPGTFLGPTSGAMGYGLPAAIAAAIARPGRPVVALAGDGGFAMTMEELETAVRERVRVVVLVFDNRRYGTIWLHQEQRGTGRGLATELGPIDFAAAAEAFGARGYRVEADDEFEPALRAALTGDRPAVLHLQLDPRWQSVDERG